MSDHHAFLLRLETVGVAALPPSPPCPGGSFYWKLNSAILRDPGFRPAFAATWEPITTTRPPDDTLLPDWWELIAKPFLIAFCRSFSALLAAKRNQSRSFFTCALAPALASRD